MKEKGGSSAGARSLGGKEKEGREGGKYKGKMKENGVSSAGAHALGEGRKRKGGKEDTRMEK